MRIVGIQSLKNQLSEYVRAAAGETVLVTDRNRVVAELVPPAAGRSVAPRDALLADAVRQGWVTPPVLAASGVPPRRPAARFDDILRSLREDRDARLSRYIDRSCTRNVSVALMGRRLEASSVAWH